MQGLAQILREHADAYRQQVNREFSLLVPKSYQIFSTSQQYAHREMVAALTWFLDQCDPWGGPTLAARERVRRIGCDHRRHGFPPEVFATYGSCLINGLDLFELSAADRSAGTRAIETLVSDMAGAAQDANLQGIPAAHQATVVAVTHPNREIALVRLETAMPIDYAPGQFFSVTNRAISGVWPSLTPAAPASPTGQLEFHLQAPYGATLGAVRLLSKAQPGEVWTLGGCNGNFAPGQPDLREVYVCFGTGWAPVRALLLERVERSIATGTALDLDCSIYLVADYPGGHYDVALQLNLRDLAPGLRLTWLVGAATNPLLLGVDPDLPAPDPAHTVVSTDPLATILQQEDTSTSRFIVVGPAHLADAAATTLRRADVPATHLDIQAWATGRAWK